MVRLSGRVKSIKVVYVPQKTGGRKMVQYTIHSEETDQFDALCAMEDQGVMVSLEKVQTDLPLEEPKSAEA